MRTTLALFSGMDDIDSHRTRLILAVKEVAYDLIITDMPKPSDNLVTLNTDRPIPNLVDRDFSLVDVNVISEYLDERYPHPPLLPVEPLGRARIRLGIKRIESDWLPLVATIHNGAKSVAETARQSLIEGLLASLPIFKASRFFLNPQMSLADIALAPLLWRLTTLGVSLPREAAPIIDYGNRIFQDPVFKKSLTESEKNMRALS